MDHNRHHDPAFLIDQYLKRHKINGDDHTQPSSDPQQNIINLLEKIKSLVKVIKFLRKNDGSASKLPWDKLNVLNPSLDQFKMV